MGFSSRSRTPSSMGEVVAMGLWICRENKGEVKFVLLLGLGWGIGAGVIVGCVSRSWGGVGFEMEGWDVSAVVFCREEVCFSLSLLCTTIGVCMEEGELLGVCVPEGSSGLDGVSEHLLEDLVTLVVTGAGGQTGFLFGLVVFFRAVCLLPECL